MSLGRRPVRRTSLSSSRRRRRSSAATVRRCCRSARSGATSATSRSRACAPGRSTIPAGHAAGACASSSRSRCRRSPRRTGARSRPARPPGSTSTRGLSGVPRQARGRAGGGDRASSSGRSRRRASRRRYRVVLDGFAVDAAREEAPEARPARLRHKRLPEPALHARLEHSPSVIGADAALQPRPARTATGMKIGVVDDGVDQTNPFFDPPASRTRPASRRADGVHDAEGDRRARLPGPRLGQPRPPRRSTGRRRSTERTSRASPPATPARLRRPDADHPTLTGLSGVAPRACLGNYRVFNVPRRRRARRRDARDRRRVRAGRHDGMDVINFSGGGPETEPANDAMIEAIRNVAAAGVVPVIAAGNDRDDFGFGPSARRAPRRTRSPSPRSRTRTSSRRRSRVDAPALPSLGTSRRPDRRRRPARLGDATSARRRRPDHRPDGKPVDRLLCGRRATRTARRRCPRARYRRDRARLARHCTFASKADARAARRRDRDRRRRQPAPARPKPIPSQLPIPAG